jgi:hypothetical protein
MLENLGIKAVGPFYDAFLLSFTIGIRFGMELGGLAGFAGVSKD